MASRAVSVERLVRESVEGLVSTGAFTSWFASERGVSGGDRVAFNNSFVYRERVKTTKSSEYLCASVDGSGAVDLKSLAVGAPPGFNVDFKRFSTKSQNLPEVRPLTPAVEEQVSRLGRFVFILIGAIDQGIQCSVPLSHGLFAELRFDPNSGSTAAIEDGRVILTKTLDDPEQVWSELQQVAVAEGIVEDQLPSDLEAPFADAFERLQQEVYSVVRLPAKTVGSAEDTLLGQLVEAIGRQASAYERAIRQCGEDPRTQPQAFGDVLRIAYNFAGDSGKLIELVVSVCDLKPVLMWCTINEHFSLAETFRNLPWVKTKKKPSLDRYEETIARARNRAFHDLIPFDRSMDVDLTDVNLRAKRLRLFSAYSRRGANVLEYEDQELVDVLTQFTRAPETAVSFAFWKRNAEVMRALERLLMATAEALVLLRRVPT